MKSAPVFEMRGLCDDTSFEKHFSLTGIWDEKSEHYNFKGYSDSSIKWNNEKKEWRLTLSQDVNIYGLCNETNGDYPFGLFNWHFFNDTCQEDSSDGIGTIIPISFSGEYYTNKINVDHYCHILLQVKKQNSLSKTIFGPVQFLAGPNIKVNQIEFIEKKYIFNFTFHSFLLHSTAVCSSHDFTCRDGTCVKLDYVCDGMMDCNDKSDELACQLVKFDPSYMRNLPPTPYKAKSKEEKTPIWIEMNVLSVLELNEINSMMKLQLELQANWIDTRLEFKHLKSGQYVNRLSSEEKKKLWLPPLRFANNKKKKKAMFEDDSIGKILLSGNASFHLHPLFQTKIYSGKDG